MCICEFGALRRCRCRCRCTLSRSKIALTKSAPGRVRTDTADPFRGPASALGLRGRPNNNAILLSVLNHGFSLPATKRQRSLHCGDIVPGHAAIARKASGRGPPTASAAHPQGGPRGESRQAGQRGNRTARQEGADWPAAGQLPPTGRAAAAVSLPCSGALLRQANDT
jgi:hypothetical protein